MNKTKIFRLIITIIMIAGIIVLLIFQGVFNGKSKEEKEKELINAIHQNDTARIHKMIDQKYPLNFLSKDGLTPLETALNDRSLESAVILLKNGAETNNKIHLPLFVQIVSTLDDYSHSVGDPYYPRTIKETINLLKLASKNKGNNINATNDMGNTALQMTAITGNPDIIRYLLQLGSNPMIKNKTEETALLIAAKAGNLEAVKVLYKYHHSNVDIDNEGNSLIYGAAMNNKLEVISYLLKQDKSGINVQNNEGKTALMISAEYGFPEIVKVLLQNGASPALKSKEGKTALDYAMHWKHEEIIKLLKRG
ncbi:ankyrin repeat domain-containing protein [Bacillus sp. BRMEA1]|uniref:ankyrin repeat domain-containing protein n=1 Tax=Neobacillus endophyticus TaxID=2738405 RepID=UPI0015674AB1|nr:ankyrin repeat domain-containing protein [Neobacillus endophyticus]NRD76012.1 ankyrin repeat domain-containing protein [Neobacillus endophyticus]